MNNCCVLNVSYYYLYVLYDYYYHIPSYSLGSIFYQYIYGFIPV